MPRAAGERKMSYRIASLFGVLVVAGCTSKETAVKEKFSRVHVCPADRVEVRERTEITRASLRVRPEPAPEVAADPERLALWTKEQERMDKNIAGMCSIYEARGCGAQQLFCCSRPPKHVDRVNCTDEAYANGVSKW